MEEKLNQIQKQITELSEQLSEGIKLFTSEIAMTKQCEMMIYKEYRGAPMIVKDGEVLNNADIDRFEVSWDKETGFKIRIGNSET